MYSKPIKLPPPFFNAYCYQPLFLRCKVLMGYAGVLLLLLYEYSRRKSVMLWRNLAYVLAFSSSLLYDTHARIFM